MCHVDRFESAWHCLYPFLCIKMQSSVASAAVQRAAASVAHIEFNCDEETGWITLAADTSAIDDERQLERREVAATYRLAYRERQLERQQRQAEADAFFKFTNFDFAPRMQRLCSFNCPCRFPMHQLPSKRQPSMRTMQSWRQRCHDGRVCRICAFAGVRDCWCRDPILKRRMDIRAMIMKAEKANKKSFRRAVARQGQLKCCSPSCACRVRDVQHIVI